MLTLKQCLSMPELGGARLVAGSVNSDVPIRMVHVIEEPDVGKWIEPDLLVLTTGHHLQSEAAAISAIRDFKAHGIAGVMVATGRYLSEISPAIRKTANEVGLAVVELPWDRPFVHIVAAVHRRIIQDATKALEEVSDIQAQLSRAALRSRSVAELERQFSQVLKHSVRVQPYDPASPLLKAGLIIPSRPDLRLVIGDLDTWVQHERLGPYIATLIAVFLLQEQIQSQVQRESRSRALLQVLALDTTEPLWDMAAFLGFSQDQRWIPIVVAPLSSFDRFTGPNGEFHQVRDELLVLSEYVTMSPTGRSVICLVPFSQSPSHTWANVVRHHPTCSVARGEPVSIETVVKEYRHWERLTLMAQPGKCHHLDDLLFPRVLSHLPDDEMRMLWERTWGRLESEVLYHTLAAWLDEDQLTIRTVERLGIHRNTLNNRLKTIEERLGWYPKGPRVMELQLALQWHRITTRQDR